MARLTKSENLEPTLNAARHWIDRCLIKDGSLFREGSLWTAANQNAVKAAFSDQLKVGPGTFGEKLRQQMSDTSPESCQLMAEMLWALLLFPTNVRAETKRAQVVGVWDWSSVAIDPNHPMLANDVLRGIGSGGTGFNNYRWKEMVYLIDLLGSLKLLGEPERALLFSDYDRYIEWIGQVPMGGQRQFRHMLRYFAFPDHVERMSSNEDRRSILQAFEIADRSDTKKWSDQKFDTAMLSLRHSLEKENPGEILDFYEEPLSSRWRPLDPEVSIREVLKRYFEEMVVFHSAERGVRYAISNVDASGVDVLRLDANQPHRMTFDRAVRLVERVVDEDLLPFSELDNTSAVRTAVLQAVELGLSPDRSAILNLTDMNRRESALTDILTNLNVQQREYKPAMLLCVLDGIDNGDLTENKIAFDWVAPRFIARLNSLGKNVTAEQAAQPFYHLTGDLIWMLAVNDLARLMNDGREGAGAARDKIKYALMKDTYWDLLQDSDARTRIRKTLETLLTPERTHSVRALSDLLSSAKETIESGGLRVQHSHLQRFVSALAAKPFLILTGLAGSGKTKLAQAFARWIASSSRRIDPFQAGFVMSGARASYKVTAADSLGIEFQSDEGTKVLLPRAIIEQWADYIDKHGIDESIGSQELRDKIKATGGDYSAYLHNFETHYKPAAFLLLKARKSAVKIPSYSLVAVGADWTGNDNVLGYPDGLHAERYVTKAALDLILQAHGNPSKPHFLILDEMNLSHVERYFADFLSAVESDEPIRLHHDGARTGNGRNIPSEVRLPSNLFVIGTVNVDETTYMFSPKVLDRANVIEFRMDDSELESFLQKPERPNFSKIDGAGDRDGFGEAFVDAAEDSSVTVPEGVISDFQNEMLLFFKILQAHGSEYGYRVAQEAARFLHYYNKFGGYAKDDSSWFRGAFDCVIVQKFLPKLHGSRPKLEGLLWALSYACGAKRDAFDSESFLVQCLEAGRAQEETKFSPDAVRAALSGTPARYPLSFDKARRMWVKLVRDQFVTFSEA